jgi:hypothetical protein
VGGASDRVGMSGSDGGGTPVRIQVGSPAPSATPGSPLPTAGPVVVVNGPAPRHEPLPFTGLDALGLCLLAALLVALGTAVLLMGRTGDPAAPPGLSP